MNRGSLVASLAAVVVAVAALIAVHTLSTVQQVEPTAALDSQVMRTLGVEALGTPPPPLPPGVPTPGISYADLVEALGLTRPEVSVFQLGPSPATRIRTFADVPICRTATLSPTQVAELLSLLRNPHAYAPNYGEPGCIGWSFGLRIHEGRKNFDLFYCPACQWLFPASNDAEAAELSLVLSSSGSGQLSKLISAALPGNPDVTRCS
jgi:hypothetical protein